MRACATCRRFVSAGKPRFARARPGFALVLALLLIVLLTAVANGLALTAATESLAASHTASRLDHDLAIDSLLVALPYLLENEHTKRIQADAVELRLLEYAIGNIAVRTLARPNSAKLAIGSEVPNDALLSRLREVASQSGLPGEDLVLEPISAVRVRETSLPALVWFDQLIRPTQFEEVFHWSVPDESVLSEYQPKPAWCDLLSFFGGGGTPYALTVVTTGAGHTRRWFLVVAIADGRAKTLYRGGV